MLLSLYIRPLYLIDTALLPLHTMIADLYCVRWILSLIISDISSTTNAFFFTTHHPSNYFRAHHDVSKPSSDRRPHHDACIQRQCNMILCIASDNIDNIDNNNSDDVNIDDSGDNSGTDNTIESDDVETDTSEEEQELTILNPNSTEYTNAAQTAENDFLTAMLQQTSNFQQIKKERGGDVAIEEFMDLIQQSDEEEARRLAEAEDGDNLVDDDHMTKIDAEGRNDTGDNSWQ